jgi:hypothetical protein
MYNDSESEIIGFNNIMNNSNLVNPDSNSKTQSNDNSGDDNSIINSNSKESNGSLN